MDVYFCDRCGSKIHYSELIIKNNKLVCPYCNHTLETDKFKVQRVQEVQESEKEEVSYEDKSTDK